MSVKNILFDYNKSVRINWNKLPEKYQKLFVADGGDVTYGRPRSPWLDMEIRRGRSKVDIAQNLLRIPQGSADQFFDAETVQKIKATYVRPPDRVGDMQYNIINQRVENAKFVVGRINSPFKWWGELEKGRPTQQHNYVVACDISRGTGASNSVIAVIDVNKSELVGLYTNPFVDVSEFAEIAVATCEWIGGVVMPFLIWEANGPGETFAARVRKLNYLFIYRRTAEDKLNRKKSKALGVRTTPGENGTKILFLGALDAALYESLKSEKIFQHLIIHDEQLCNELLDYIFLGDRIDVGLSSQALESSGARSAHGDRVMAVAIALLGTKEQVKGQWKRKKTPPVDSFQHRFNLVEKELEEEKQYSRRFLF